MTITNLTAELWPCDIFGCACPDFLADGTHDEDPCRCGHPDTDHLPEGDPE